MKWFLHYQKCPLCYCYKCLPIFLLYFSYPNFFGYCLYDISFPDILLFFFFEVKVNIQHCVSRMCRANWFSNFFQIIFHYRFCKILNLIPSAVQFSSVHSVMSDSLWPHRPLHARNCWSLPKLISIKSVMPSNHLILCRPLLLLLPIFPNISSVKFSSVAQ